MQAVTECVRTGLMLEGRVEQVRPATSQQLGQPSPQAALDTTYSA